MKLDKIRFAQLIAYISKLGAELTFNSVRDIDSIVDIEVPAPTVQALNIELLHELLVEMRSAKDGRFIPAIKAYRALTGAGLKEAKEAVEKYR